MTDQQFSSSVTPKRSLRWVAISIFVIGILGLVGVFGYVALSKRGGVAQIIALARADFEGGRYAQALAGFAEASNRQPDDPRFAQAAAESAIGANRRAEAILYAQRAWDLGLRSENLLAMLFLQPGLLDTPEGRNRAKSLINQLPDKASQSRSEARLALEEKRIDDCIALWQISLQLDAHADAIDEYVTVLADHARSEELIRYANSLRTTQQLTAYGYRQLALAYAYTNLQKIPAEQQDTLAILREAETRTAWDDRSRLDGALHAWFKLDHQTVIDWTSAITDPAVAIDGTLFHALSLIDTNQLEAAAALTVPPEAHGPRAEGLAQALRACSNSASVNDRILALLKAEKLLGPHPVISVLLGRLHQQNNEFEQGLNAYGSIDGLASLAPTVLIEQAALLLQLGRDDAALSMLGTSERIHGSTRRSLLLLDQITQKHANSHLREAVQLALARVQPSSAPIDDLPIGGAGALSLSAADQNSLNGIRTAISQGRYQQALDRCGQLTLSNPILSNPTLSNPILAAYRTLALQGLGQAAAAYEQALIACTVPQPLVVHLGMAAAALQLNKFTEADAILSEQDSLHAQHPEITRLRIISALAQGHPEDAQQHLAQAGDALTPSEAISLQALVALAENDTDMALSILLTGRSQIITDSLAVHILGSLLIKSGRPAEADQLYVDAIQAGAPDQSLRLQLARLRADQQQYTEALSMLPAVSDDPAVANVRIDILIRSKNLTEARRAIDALPASTPVGERLILQASVERAAGRPAAAATLLANHLHDDAVLLSWLDIISNDQVVVDIPAKILKLPPNRLRSILSAAAAERTQRFDQAFAITDAALPHWPQDAALLNNWAWYAHHLNTISIDVILQRSQQAITLAPNDANLRDTYLEMCISRELWDLAERQLADCQDLLAGSATLRLHQGRLALHQGNTQAAREAFTEALRLADQEPTWPLRWSRDELTAQINATP